MKTLAFGLTVYWLTTLIRTPSFMQGYLIRGIKPLACDLCMSFWTSVVIGSFLFVVGTVLTPLEYMGGAGAGLAILRYNGRVGKLELPPDDESTRGP
jgi:hypothetical protein